MPAPEHIAHAQKQQPPIGCAVLTVSDTRTAETDESGQTISDLLGAHDHAVVDRAIVRDEPEDIRATIERWMQRADINIIITTGGTGFSRRDTTIEVVESLLTKKLDGFGELFRAISFEEIGPAAMLSRATAGLIVSDDHPPVETFLFALPGSVNAVKTAMTRLIIPQLKHLLWLRKK